jgi:hypothetical protein
MGSKEDMTITIPAETRKRRCRAARDGECVWSECPQLRDGEPVKSGRHCPYDTRCRYCGEYDDGHACG